MNHLNIHLEQIIPAIRMMLSEVNLKTLKINPNTETTRMPEYLEIKGATADEILENAKKRICDFKEKTCFLPKALLIEGIGMVAVGDNAAECDVVFDGILTYSCAEEKIVSARRAENKNIIVTGAAQGFGEGIAECLMREGANIVVADLNEEVGQKTVEKFNSIAKKNRAIFVKTNVADIPSIENLVRETVCNFGGVDCFISNAGVLRAGGLDDMTPENFDFVTKINYNAYFYCTKVVSKVMKLQTRFAADEYYADIIQINSKSGLRGSRANFAYAGGKFGGIGLTQSFALELAPFRIKVNSICPGNFYEGPLWSDPENGLFVQYLKAGKVPGAKTIDDVKAFYLAQVPMHKGCSPADVTKGALYLMEQCGETGQALPITGGQVMMS